MSTLQTDVIFRSRPRSVVQITDAAFRLYRQNFLSFLTIVAVIFLPIQLLLFLADYDLFGRYGGTSFLVPSPGSALTSGYVVGQFNTLADYTADHLTDFARWALVIVITNVIAGYRLSAREAYVTVWRQLKRVLGFILLQILIAAGLAVVPLVLLVLLLGSKPDRASDQLFLLNAVLTVIYNILLLGFMVALPAAVDEELSPAAALGRSWTLINGYWWRTLGLSLIVSVINFILLLVADATLGALLDFVFRFSQNSNLTVLHGIEVLVYILFAPIDIAVVTFYYFDLRVRKEGFDLDSAIAERYEQEEEIPAQSVRQDRDLFPLLATVHSSEAMNAFQQRTMAVPTLDVRRSNVRRVKRKVDRPASSYFDVGVEQ